MKPDLMNSGIEIIAEKGYILVIPATGINFWEIFITVGKLIPMPEFADMDDIWVFREGSVDFVDSDFHKLKDFGTQYCPENAKGRKTAIVVASGFQHDLAKRYVDIGNPHPRRIRVFSDFKTAEDWIAA